MSKITLGQNPRGPGQAEAIASLVEQGLSPSEIGKRMGIGRARVGHIARIHDLPISNTMAARPLSKRQADVLAYIRDFTARNSYPPTIREITGGCNLSSTSVADYNLLCLEERGYLNRIPGTARGIVLAEWNRPRPQPEPRD